MITMILLLKLSKLNIEIQSLFILTAGLNTMSFVGRHTGSDNPEESSKLWQLKS